MLAGVTIGLRAFQFLFSVVVLGLAATLISNQIYGSSPTTTRYSTFTGGFGIIVGAIGAAGLYINAIPEIIVLGLDALAGIFFAAGGIAWAIGLKGISCSLGGETTQDEYQKAIENELINQGSVSTPDGTAYGVARSTTDGFVILDRLNGNCKKGLADEVIQFILFALAIALVVLGYIRLRKGGRTGGSYV